MFEILAKNKNVYYYGIKKVISIYYLSYFQLNFITTEFDLKLRFLFRKNAHTYTELI